MLLAGGAATADGGCAAAIPAMPIDQVQIAIVNRVMLNLLWLLSP
jgi:hypothetical protein